MYMYVCIYIYIYIYIYIGGGGASCSLAPPDKEIREACLRELFGAYRNGSRTPSRPTLFAQLEGTTRATSVSGTNYSSGEEDTWEIYLTKTPQQGLDSSFCCYVARQRLAQKQYLFTDTGKSLRHVAKLSRPFFQYFVFRQLWVVGEQRFFHGADSPFMYGFYHHFNNLPLGSRPNSTPWPPGLLAPLASWPPGPLAAWPPPGRRLAVLAVLATPAACLSSGRARHVGAAERRRFGATGRPPARRRPGGCPLRAAPCQATASRRRPPRRLASRGLRGLRAQGRPLRRRRLRAPRRGSQGVGARAAVLDGVWRASARAGRAASPGLLGGKGGAGGGRGCKDGRGGAHEEGLSGAPGAGGGRGHEEGRRGARCAGACGRGLGSTSEQPYASAAAAAAAAISAATSAGDGAGAGPSITGL